MKAFNILTKEKQKELIDYTIQSLEERKGQDPEASEIHQQLFNEDYYIIGTYQAKQWMEKIDIFEVMETITDYETEMFGGVTTDLSSPELVVNMFVYIIGEEIIQESETLQDMWDQHLEDEDIDQIIEEIEELSEELKYD